MSDRIITLINCTTGDVFEASKKDVLSWVKEPAFDVVHHVGITFGDVILVKDIVLTDYDFDRDVYTMECK